METKIIAGKAFGVAAGGTIISMNNADITSILSAASGLAKFLFSFVGKGLLLATGLAGLYLALSSNKEERGMRLDIMSKINTEKRKFYGICISETLTIRSSGEKLSIPTEYVKYINYENVFFHNLDITVGLFDGSEYKLDRGGEEASLSFLTTVGKQNIKIGYNSLDGDDCVSGGTVQERGSFIGRLNNFLNEKDETIVDLLGKENFEKFFYPGI